MLRRRVHWSDVIFALLVMVAPMVAGYHASGGRYGNAAIAAAAFVAGAWVLIWSLRQPEVAAAPVARAEVHAVPARPAVEREPGGRQAGWLPSAILSGALASAFATVVLSVIYSYIVAQGSATSSGGVISGWSSALYRYVMANRSPLDLALAMGLQLVLGVGWAIIYASAVEPLLSGPGWLRGLVFAAGPWLGGVVVVLPIIGAGPLGLSVSAGPLPVLGALLASLLYSPALGALYAREDVLVEGGQPVDPRERAALRRTETLMAAGLLPGMLLGGLVSLLAANVVAPGQDPWIATTVGAVFGGAIAVLLVPFFGMRAEKTR